MQVPKTIKKQSFKDQQQTLLQKHQQSDTTADLPAGTGQSTIEAPVAHADHLTLQEGTEEAPHLGLIRSVTLLPLYIQDQKID